MTFRRWLPVAALAAISQILAFLVAHATGYPMRPFGFNGWLLMIVAIVGLIWWGQLLAYMTRLWRNGRESPVAAIRRDWREALPSVLSGTVGIILIVAYLHGLSTLKVMITAVIPFWADAPLLAVDRAVLGDIQVIARALSPVMPAIDWLYSSWQVVNLIGFVWVLHWRGPEGQRLVIAYMLTWGIGMAFAYLGSSAGPLFTGAYDPQLAPDAIRHMSAGMWNNHISQGSMIGAGISAFPSMHVAISVWFAFVLREKGLGWLGSTYAFAIFLCSVLIGWHYILDGVGGALIAWLAYYLGNRQATASLHENALPWDTPSPLPR